MAKRSEDEEEGLRHEDDDPDLFEEHADGDPGGARFPPDSIAAQYILDITGAGLVQEPARRHHDAAVKTLLRSRRTSWGAKLFRGCETLFVAKGKDAPDQDQTEAQGLQLEFDR